MTKRLFAALSTILFMAVCLGAALAAEPMLNGGLTRYPGAARVEGESFDGYYFNHGWLSRQAAYQSPDDLHSVLSWYAADLPQADLHEAGACVTLRQTQAVVRVQHTVSVLMCQVPSGTRILVNEDLLVSL